MSVQKLHVYIVLTIVAGIWSHAWSDTTLSAGETAKTWTFDSDNALTGWVIDGNVNIDSSRTRQGTGGALKVGPGGKAVLRFRDEDESGRVDVWVYDDSTVPEDAKARRVGPRWGLVQSDGNVLAIGALYANYLGGDEGYTASACDGKSWFDQLFWLGIRRTPAGWHKWTFDFDPEVGLQVLHNDKEVTAVDSRKTGLKGFHGFAVWGDDGKGHEQTIWLDDLSVILGGPVVLPPVIEANPYDEESLAADMANSRPVVIYSRQNVPVSPSLDDLPLKESVSQHGITWTFDKPAPVGQFVNGDWYVVGPMTIKAIDPKPLYGSEIPRRELDATAQDRIKIIGLPKLGNDSAHHAADLIPRVAVVPLAEGLQRQLHLLEGG